MELNCLGHSCVGSSGINGDAFYISRDEKIFLLADGASGAGKEGKVLMGKICIEEVENYDFLSSGLSSKEYLNKLVWNINNRLIEVSQKHNKVVFGTIVLAIINDDELTITAIGDSPAYYFNGKEAIRLAKNPKKYEWMIDQGFITREQYEGYISNMHSMMWSCFDNFIPMVVPNNIIETIKVKPNDILVLCCDGVSDWTSADEIMEEIRNEDLNCALNNIITKSKERSLEKSNHFDDMTIVAVKCI